MDYIKKDMKFIRTSNKETADKLKYEGFTQIASQNSNEFIFVNDGKRLAFDVEKFDGIYTNILNI